MNKMIKMIKRCWTIVAVLIFLHTAAFGAVTLQEWNSGNVGILMTRQEVLSAIGSPDGSEGTTEWYDISGDEGLSRVTLDYLGGERVQAVHLAFRTGSVDLETLSSIVRSAFPGIPEVHSDDRMAIFLGRSNDTGEPVYFLALAEDPQKGRGPELISMTESANSHYQGGQNPE
ncbi:MAG TPA: hypothetical protein DDW96_01085 [Synergistaceae bacterium]|jgi:hypothetical protein|nr:hypothetical protein [Synergistaceae bacterium]